MISIKELKQSNTVEKGQCELGAARLQEGRLLENLGPKIGHRG